MVKYHLHENRWTVILDDVDFKTITQDDVNHIARLISTNTLVIARKQFLSIADEVRVVKMFKDPFAFDPNDPEREGYKDAIVPDSEGLLIRVTGAKDENGNPGFAGDDDELKWHCNDSTRSQRRSIVWLSGEHGTVGSRTTWNNNILSYRDLSQEWKDKLAPIQSRMKHWRDNDDNNPGEEYWTPNIVHTNIAGITGLFFPFLQIHGFANATDDETKTIMDYLTDHTTQEKYLYHHDWQDGDITLSEQWLGIHKRWAFPNMVNRLLHRIVFNFPDQDYK
jgi:alpha-ketoglutarate-dependent taurine dioxygenase